MKIAYLILVHDHPAHLARMIERLACDDALFYVHVDAKVDARQFEAVRGPRVVFCEQRVRCAWGDISLVDATLQLARLALSGPRCDYHVLLSGACYPIQSRDYIASFLERHRGTEFLQAFPFPDPRFGKPMRRLTAYFLKRSPPFAGLKWRLQQALQRVLPARDPDKALGGIALATGSQWWTLTHAALTHAVGYVDQHPQFYKFCRHVDCPDELVFQLVLWNSRFRASISHSLTYTDWPPGSASPATIDDRAIDRFAGDRVTDSERNNCPQEKREVLFARKVADAPSVTAAIDRLVDLKSACAAGERPPRVTFPLSPRDGAPHTTLVRSET